MLPTASSRQQVDVSAYRSSFSLKHRLGRRLWHVVWLLLFRPSPVFLFGWRRFLLRCFGARLSSKAHIYPSCKIWAPWNLEVDDYGCLGFDVDCYCVDKIHIGRHATVSQYSFLCSASHDITDPHMRLVTAPITIADSAWVCAGAFIGPGVIVGEGAVVAARAVVTKSVEPWAVVAGNPARFIKTRQLTSQ